MSDFLMTALPFVIIGFCVAVLCANHKRWQEKDNYMTQGMSAGMCLGVSAAVAFGFNIGLGVIMGMLVGMTVGTLIKKESDS